MNTKNRWPIWDSQDQAPATSFVPATGSSIFGRVLTIFLNLLKTGQPSCSNCSPLLSNICFLVARVPSGLRYLLFLSLSRKFFNDSSTHIFKTIFLWLRVSGTSTILVRCSEFPRFSMRFVGFLYLGRSGSRFAFDIISICIFAAEFSPAIRTRLKWTRFGSAGMSPFFLQWSICMVLAMPEHRLETSFLINSVSIVLHKMHQRLDQSLNPYCLLYGTVHRITSFCKSGNVGYQDCIHVALLDIIIKHFLKKWKFWPLTTSFTDVSWT